jgi:hypothetical protein
VIEIDWYINGGWDGQLKWLILFVQEAFLCRIYLFLSYCLVVGGPQANAKRKECKRMQNAKIEQYYNKHYSTKPCKRGQNLPPTYLSPIITYLLLKLIINLSINTKEWKGLLLLLPTSTTTTITTILCY